MLDQLSSKSILDATNFADHSFKTVRHNMYSSDDEPFVPPVPVQQEDGQDICAGVEKLRKLSIVPCPPDFARAQFANWSPSVPIKAEQDALQCLKVS